MSFYHKRCSVSDKALLRTCLALSWSRRIDDVQSIASTASNKSLYRIPHTKDEPDVSCHNISERLGPPTCFRSLSGVESVKSCRPVCSVRVCWPSNRLSHPIECHRFTSEFWRSVKPSENSYRTFRPIEVQNPYHAPWATSKGPAHILNLTHPRPLRQNSS